MKITVTGHSLIHPRQYMLFSFMGANGLADVQVLSPTRWGSELGHTVQAPNYYHECLEPVGQSMTSFRLRGLEDHIREFNPDVLYAMEEPFTSFTGQCATIAANHNIPFAVFTWENILNKSFGERNDKIEEEVIEKANILIAGNEGAKRRMMMYGAAEDKIAICPQTGISTDIFKPMPDVEKTHDVAYFGRMVREKGIEHIETVVKNLNLKMLWVGGRGNIIPSYGDYIGWVDYLRLPEYYNKTKLFVTYPYALNGYSEQMNFTIGESMACGTPVVSSTNGSIYGVYYSAPIDLVVEGTEDYLEEAIANALDNPTQEILDRGIKWVHDNLSIDVIAHRLLKILKGA